MIPLCLFLLRNIGTYCHHVPHIDVEIIVSEHSPSEAAATTSKEIHTDKLLIVLVEMQEENKQQYIYCIEKKI